LHERLALGRYKELAGHDQLPVEKLNVECGVLRPIGAAPRIADKKRRQVRWSVGGIELTSATLAIVPPMGSVFHFALEPRALFIAAFPSRFVFARADIGCNGIVSYEPTPSNSKRSEQTRTTKLLCRAVANPDYAAGFGDGTGTEVQRLTRRRWVRGALWRRGLSNH